MKPIPPQNWRQLSPTSLAKRPPFNLAMDASLVTSLPLMYNAAEKKGRIQVVAQARVSEKWPCTEEN